MSVKNVCIKKLKMKVLYFVELDKWHMLWDNRHVVG